MSRSMSLSATDLHLFESRRPFLTGLAYRILGSYSDAEDVVQDTFITWAETPRESIINPPAWLTTICTRRSIDILRSAQHKRTDYIGPWLPEPFYEPAFNEQESDETLSTAFLLLLEKLSPKERAAYLLYEVFDQRYNDIADTLDISYDLCRQLVARARQNIAQEKRKHPVSKPQQQKLLAAFQLAVSNGSVEQLSQLLSEDIQLHADGGGKVSAVAVPLYSKYRVLRFFERLLFANWSRLQWHMGIINDGAGFSFRDGSDKVIMIVTFAYDEQQHISGIYVQRNPDKLSIKSQHKLALP